MVDEQKRAEQSRTLDVENKIVQVRTLACFFLLLRWCVFEKVCPFSANDD